MAPLASGAQAALLSLASKSLRREIARFPNFLATRVTTRFEDTPSLPATLDRPAGWYRPLHWVGTSTTNVLNRNGQEVVDPGQAKEAKSGYKPQGLSTSGEFGTILIILMTDVFRSPIAWVGWESGAAGPLAVFHYSVSSPNSHYQVDVPSKLGILETLPAYHGEIAVDAASGTIVRATLEAELKPNTAVTLANLLVEYGPVEIGGETYILPTRCVALSAVRLTVVHRLANGFGDVGFQFGPQKTEVNDIRFTHYHLFRAETRIVVDENVPPAASPAARESPPPSN